MITATTSRVPASSACLILRRRRSVRAGAANRAASASASAPYRVLKRDFGLSFDGPTRPPIGQPLTFDALQRGNGPLRIRDAETGAVVVAKIELTDIPLQVSLADM